MAKEYKFKGREKEYGKEYGKEYRQRPDYKEKRRNYYYKNHAHLLELASSSRKRRRDEIRRQAKEYNQKNRDRVNYLARLRRHKNGERLREFYRKYNREYRKTAKGAEKTKSQEVKYRTSVKGRLKRRAFRHNDVVLLTDRYIKDLLVSFSSLSYRDIPQELIEAKRVHLQLKRALKHKGDQDGLTNSQ